jgi:hypothetical protein
MSCRENQDFDERSGRPSPSNPAQTVPRAGDPLDAKVEADWVVLTPVKSL